MNIETILKKTIEDKENHIRGNGDVYITPKNMESFTNYLKNCDCVPNLLVTPYLINTKEDALLELHYYEFELEVLDVPQSYFVEYPDGNNLPEEIIKNIKPKAIVAKNDKTFSIDSLRHYIRYMQGMEFEKDRNSNKKLEKADLFYQIF